ncbi:MAG: ADP-ribosylglycohydrolase family protein, partial [Lachnospiraceae bacterium]|nr:ADP-ribosylglycohydrolase family protein [Lachnospiraceae bacterium]
DFELFGKNCTFTDDSVMTIAIAEGLMNGGAPDDYIKAMKRLGRIYSDVGYGPHFCKWLSSDDANPYNSWGNGSAMRVSAVGWAYDSLESTENAAETSAAVTHNHPEGIKGAQATAASIFLARNGKTKEEIKTYIEDRFGYDLSRALDEIRPSYEFDVSCMGTVPEAIIAFLESDGFEDAIRNAVSLGGDSDTLAAITGSIAEAAYGIPEPIRSKALSLVDEPLLEVYNRFSAYLAGLQPTERGQLSEEKNEINEVEKHNSREEYNPHFMGLSHMDEISELIHTAVTKNRKEEGD